MILKVWAFHFYCWLGTVVLRLPCKKDYGGSNPSASSTEIGITVARLPWEQKAKVRLLHLRPVFKNSSIDQLWQSQQLEVLCSVGSNPTRTTILFEVIYAFLVNKNVYNHMKDDV